MSNIKVLKQDVISSLKHNLTENNIDDFISDFKINSKLGFNIKILEKGYKLYESYIISQDENFKNSGYGRTKYEALSNALINLVESILGSEKYIDPIKESLKIFLKHNKYYANNSGNSNNNKTNKNGNNNNNNNINSNPTNPNCITTNTNTNTTSSNNKNKLFYYSGNKNNNNTNNNTNTNNTNNNNNNSNYSNNPNSSSNKRLSKEIITIDNSDNETKVLVSMLNNDKSTIPCHQEDFTIEGLENINIQINKSQFNIFETSDFLEFKNDYEEKTLIIFELEKMILDLMHYHKKLAEIINAESEDFPDYYKCPISWEKLSNPVVSCEGHSYEKWAIDKWLLTQETSPITGLTLESHNLIHNYALKSAMDDYIRRNSKWKRIKQDMSKFLTKSEYDLNDLKKYFPNKG